MALTPQRLLWFKASAGLSIGPKPKELLLQWPHEQIQSLIYSPKGISKFPTFLLTFADGSQVPLISEKGQQPHLVAEAWERIRPDDATPEGESPPP